MRWTLLLLLWLAGTSWAAQNDPLEITMEGPGPFHMDDAERISPVVRRSLVRRFPAGFAHAQVTLVSEESSAAAFLQLVVREPRDHGDFESLEARIAVTGWRKYLDGGSSSHLEMKLVEVRATLKRSRLEQLFSTDESPSAAETMALQRLGPRASFSRPPEFGADSTGFSRAAQDAGFPPVEGDRFRSPHSEARWTLSGKAGSPIGRWVAGVLSPQVDAGGRLGLGMDFLACRGRPLQIPEVLAVERRLGDRLRERWTEMEQEFQCEVYLREVEVVANGSLALKGVGFLALDAEREILQDQDRRQSWKPSLLLNAAR